MAVLVGVVEDVVIRYPATPILSVAVNDRMATVSVLAVAGRLKEVTDGGVVSAPVDNVITTVALKLLDTFPAASFAYAYSLWVPEEAKV